MRPGEIVVGMLYGGGLVNGLPVYSQPGGIGTQVVPGMPQFLSGQPAVYPSLYAWGCGHRTNTAEIFEVFNPYEGVQQALVCCPICRYVNTIISPYSSYQSYIDTPLVLD